jgi:hypothetical protein
VDGRKGFRQKNRRRRPSIPRAAKSSVTRTHARTTTTLTNLDISRIGYVYDALSSIIYTTATRNDIFFLRVKIFKKNEKPKNNVLRVKSDPATFDKRRSGNTVFDFYNRRHDCAFHCTYIIFVIIVLFISYKAKIIV